MLIERTLTKQLILDLFDLHPVVIITGPRQCGKTTLAKMLSAAENKKNFFDVERPSDRQRLATPERTLSTLEGLVVIDEIQRLPKLLETIRYLVDWPQKESKYLLLGSVSYGLTKDTSESLAGRVGLVELSGFNLNEVANIQTGLNPENDWVDLWMRGGFPRSYLASSDRSSYLWRQNFARTFIERDIPQMKLTSSTGPLQRFWTMLAHYHGNIWNAAEFARSLGSSEPTARRYLDILCESFVVRRLQPWHEKLKKRQIKSPKVYIRDSGLLHALLGTKSEFEVTSHPKLGASFEGFVIEQILQSLQGIHTYFWGTHAGAELDLMFSFAGRRFGIEIKFSESPKVTKSMRVAISDLQLTHLWVVYPGTESFSLETKISVLPAGNIGQLLYKLNQRELDNSIVLD